MSSCAVLASKETRGRVLSALTVNTPSSVASKARGPGPAAVSRCIPGPLAGKEGNRQTTWPGQTPGLGYPHPLQGFGPPCCRRDGTTVC